MAVRTNKGATYKFELKKRTSKTGAFPVYLRITKDRKMARVKTSVEILTLRHWNDDKCFIRASSPNYQIYKNLLDDVLLKARECEKAMLVAGQVVTAKAIAKKMIAKEEVFSFFEWADDYINGKYKAGAFSTSKRFTTIILKLRMYVNGLKPQKLAKISYNSKEYVKMIYSLKEDLTFDEITADFVAGFEAYLHEVPNSRVKGKKLLPQYVGKIMKIFKHLYNEGRKEKQRLGMKFNENPFEGLTWTEKNAEKERLSVEEIKALEALKLEEDSLLWHTRNAFLLSFYCAGVRAGDLLLLRGSSLCHENGSWFVRYKMNKTGHVMQIYVVEEAMKILQHYVDFDKLTDDYILPFLNNGAYYANFKDLEAMPYETKAYLMGQISSKNTILNKYLEKLAAMAGITKKVTMHIARHSFADISRKMGVSVYDTSKSLGHSDIKITQTYLASFDNEAQENAMKKMFASQPEASSASNEENLVSVLKSMSKEELLGLLAKVSQ